MLPFEQWLASEQHAVGCVEKYPFSLKPKSSARAHQKPTPLPADRRAWVNKEFEDLLRAGVVKRVPTAQCTSKVVLVEEGQEGQSFRMCINFIDVNQMVEEEKYIMKDAAALVDLWRDATLGTLLDMKACYHNVPVETNT